MKRGIPLLAALLCLAPALRADELRLKDGSKVVGKIVGFEDNCFKVETSYGYALVRKDQVVSIVVADEAKKPAGDKKVAASLNAKPGPASGKPTAGDAKTSAAAEPENGAVGAGFPPPTKGPSGSLRVNSASSAPTDANAPAADQPVGPSEKAAATEAVASAAATPTGSHDARLPTVTPRASAASRTAPAASPAKPATAASPESATTTAAPGPPAAKAQPEPMREQIVGNSYINETYSFRMYKPPDWEVIADGPKMLPGAIVAMGTPDQKTYLLIGQEPVAGPMEAQLAPTEKRLRAVLENYRPLGDKRFLVSGAPAIQRRFRGTVEDHDWSGSVTLIAKDNQLLTIFGMTSADSDLVQIQENIIARTVASLEFTKPPVASGGAR